MQRQGFNMILLLHLLRPNKCLTFTKRMIPKNETTSYFQPVYPDKILMMNSFK